MYSKFVITLRRVGFEAKEFPDAPEILENEYNKLIKKVNKYALKNSEALKQYCILNLNEILKQEREIENRLNKLELKPEELKTLSLQEYEARQNELRYFYEIHNWCGDAEAVLVEYLANYYPKWNTDPENLQIIRKLLPKYNSTRQMVEQEHQKKTEKAETVSEIPQVKEHLPKETELLKIEKRPIIALEKIKELFEILKGYFEPIQHNELNSLLTTGKRGKQKLIFKDNANRLTDTFKQLIENNLITGCKKDGLENWIIANFQFLKEKTPTDFKKYTVHKNISGKYYPCNNRIIIIENGNILIADEKTRKQQ